MERPMGQSLQKNQSMVKKIGAEFGIWQELATTSLLEVVVKPVTVGKHYQDFDATLSSKYMPIIIG